MEANEDTREITADVSAADPGTAPDPSDAPWEGGANGTVPTVEASSDEGAVKVDTSDADDDNVATDDEDSTATGSDPDAKPLTYSEHGLRLITEMVAIAQKIHGDERQTALYLSLGFRAHQLMPIATNHGSAKDIKVGMVLADVQRRCVGIVPDGANRPENWWNAWGLFALLTGAEKPMLSKKSPDAEQAAVVAVWSYPDLAILRSFVVRKGVEWEWASTRHEGFVRDALRSRFKGLKLIAKRDEFKALLIADREAEQRRGKSADEIARIDQQKLYAERERAVRSVKTNAKAIIEKAKEAKLTGADVREMMQAMGAIDTAPRPAMDLDATVRAMTPSNAADFAERLIKNGDRAVVLAVYRRLKTFVHATKPETKPAEEAARRANRGAVSVA